MKLNVNVNAIIIYSLTIWLVTICLVIWTNNIEVLQEVSVIMGNLISGWLGYLVKSLED